MAVAGVDQEEDGAENFLETEILLGKLIRILPHSTPLELGLEVSVKLRTLLTAFGLIILKLRL